MSAKGIDIPKVGMPPQKLAVSRAILFVVPSLAVTAISIFLFTTLGGFTMDQLHSFSITIMAAVIISLVGSAGMQVLVYRMIDEAEIKNEAAARAIRIGTLFSLIFSIGASALFYPYLLNYLGFPLPYFMYLAALMVFYSITWIITAAFWATGQYKYPAVIYTISYLIVLSLSYGFHHLNPENTLTGYTIGIALLLWLSAFGATRAFGGNKRLQENGDKFSGIWGLVTRNVPGIMINTFYILAIFLDKIIVWVVEGLMSGKGLQVVGNYSVGAFLGLMPMFSSGVVAYFTYRSTPLIENRYKGTFEEIRERVSEYKRACSTGLTAMLALGLGIFAIVYAVAFYYIKDALTLRVLITTSIGSLFFVMIIYSAGTLAIFGKSGILAVAMLAVCIGELLSIFLVGVDVWFASVGFMLGSFVGFLISYVAMSRLIFSFEYNMFCFVARSAFK